MDDCWHVNTVNQEGALDRNIEIEASVEMTFAAWLFHPSKSMHLTPPPTAADSSGPKSVRTKTRAHRILKVVTERADARECSIALNATALTNFQGYKMFNSLQSYLQYTAIVGLVEFVIVLVQRSNPLGILGRIR